jgi:hypothetical protein
MQICLGQKVYLQNIQLGEVVPNVIVEGKITRIYKNYFSVYVGCKVRDFKKSSGLELTSGFPAWRVLIAQDEIEVVETKKTIINNIISILSSKVAICMPISDLNTVQGIIENSLRLEIGNYE